MITASFDVVLINKIQRLTVTVEVVGKTLEDVCNKYKDIIVTYEKGGWVMVSNKVTSIKTEV